MSVGKGRRLAALLLCLAMMFSTLGATVPASAADPAAGLCEHHPEHTPECGYIAPSEGTPCQHVHDASCGYVAPVPETPCDMGCTDTDGDGVIDHMDGCAYTPATEGSPCQHVHDESCGYSEATAGSPCQYVCDICAGSTPEPEATDAPADTPVPEATDAPADTPDPEATDAPAETPVPEATETPADTPVPEATDAPADTPDPEATTEPTDTPAPTETPEPEEEPADDDIMLLALTAPTVTVKQSGSADSTPITEGSDTELTWVHNQNYQLDVSTGGAAKAKVKITVAPGLKINTYYNTTANFESITPSRTYTASDGLTGYQFPVAYDTLEYVVSGTAASISLDVTLAVDTVLWPKTDGWRIENAIKVEFFEDGEDTAAYTRTANVTVNRATDEASPSWNRLYVSDSNNSVPTTAGEEFRMKIFQIAPNLHGTTLGFYYQKLTVTIPLPHVSETYAQYSSIICSRGDPPTHEVNEGNHTITFTWNNIYVPAGTGFSFTPYFQWGSAQAQDAQVGFDASQFKVEAAAYGSLAVPFENSLGDLTFHVRGDSWVTIDGRNRSRQIYNYGSTTQVYQLGQFKVRNDGFGDTGELILTFTFSENVAHVTAQGIPLGVDGRIVSINYKSHLHSESTPAVISESNYHNRDSYRRYMLIADDDDWFTEITAVISGLPAQFIGYNASAEESPNNDAVTYGTMADTATTGAFSPSLKITGTTVQAADGVTGTYTSTIITNAGKQTTQMTVAAGSGASLFTFNETGTTSVQLGTDVDDRTIHYNAIISATDYPYTNNQVVDRPVIYLRLPNTITVQSIELRSVQTGGGSELIGSEHYTIEGPFNRGGDNYHVYKIEFLEGHNNGAIGYFNRQLGGT